MTNKDFNKQKKIANKICRGCGVALTVSNITDRKAQLNIYECNDCVSNGNAKRTLQIKSLIMEKYGGKCMHCGETELAFLTIDHIDETGSEHRRKLLAEGTICFGSSFYYWLKQQGYPKDNYQILCWNCNIFKHRQKLEEETAKNITAYNKQRNQERRETKIETINSYGGKCVCCGETNILILAIDHIHGDGAIKRRNGIDGKSDKLYKKLKSSGFPQGDYQTLCHNCNFAKHICEICPHQQKDKPEIILPSIKYTNIIPKLTQKQEEEIKIRYKKKHQSLRSLAKDFEVSVKMIRRIVRDIYVPKEPILTKTQEAEIIAKYLAKPNKYALRKEYNIGKSVLNRILKIVPKI